MLVPAHKLIIWSMYGVNLPKHKVPTYYIWSTFSWGPLMFLSSNQPSTKETLKSISQALCLNRYRTTLLRYWIIAKIKKFSVLNGCIISVKFSKSRWCFSWTPARSSRSISRNYQRTFMKAYIYSRHLSIMYRVDAYDKR